MERPPLARSSVDEAPLQPEPHVLDTSVIAKSDSPPSTLSVGSTVHTPKSAGWSSTKYVDYLSGSDVDVTTDNYQKCKNKFVEFMTQKLQWLCGRATNRASTANTATATPIPSSHKTSDLHASPSPDVPKADGSIRLDVKIIGEHPVGLGGSSDVWQGTLGPMRSLVAVKVLRQFGRGSIPDRLHKHLQREVLVWKLLDHESISKFHGVVYNSNGAPALVSPWYQNGSADEYLQQHPDINPMKLIWEILLGVEYLHEKDIVHGDLKGANVMVDDAGHAKLIDFGLSRLIDPIYGTTGLTTSTLALSIRWCAPELFAENARVTKSSDVYAFASTALQLLTGSVPYSSQQQTTVLWTVMNKVPPQRPSSPLHYPIDRVDELWELLELCWAGASERPTISEVKCRMRILYPEGSVNSASIDY